jgi:preprotein translocase subunit SecF
VQTFGDAFTFLVRVQQQESTAEDADTAQQDAVEKVKNKLAEVLGQQVEFRRTEVVGPTVGAELIRKGIYAVVFSMLGIMAYIWARFEWQFGVGAVMALLHDVLATLGLFALTQIDFNLATVAAILTVAGYSINDTVVVFDRVRENLRKYKKMPFIELLNKSVNETLSRTFLTSFTTMLAMFALFLFGGEVIASFTIALMWGIFVGTYSSIYVATPVLIYLKLRSDDANSPENT